MTEHSPELPERPASTASIDLPVLTDERMDAIESRVLERIHAERGATRHRGARRAWLGAGAAAAVIVAAALVAPTALTAIGGGGLSYSTESAGDFAATESGAEPAPAPGVADSDLSGGGQDSAGEDSAGGSDALGPDVAEERAIIATGSVTLEVDDVRVAADELAARAEALGGFVENTDLDTTGLGDDNAPVGEYAPDSMPYRGSSWVQVRVPAEALTEAMEELSDIGTVVRSSVTREDVTQTALDLQAQVESAEASVKRLTELMDEAGSLSDLIAAESALTERQWMLQSAQQQLESLEGQVAMSSLTVSLTEETEAVTANPAGFGDGISAGWNGLLATLNGLVIGLGFLLPWLAVLAVAGVVVWLVVRAARRRRGARRPAEASATDPDAAA